MNIIKCNQCAVSSCSHWTTKKINGQIVNVPLIEDSSNCSSFKEYDTYKLPMLLHLSMPNKIDSLNKMLSDYGIKLIEKEHYPYFILRLR